MVQRPLGRRKRLYDTPRTPYRRLLEAGILSRTQQVELAAYKATLNPARIAEGIDHLQQRLIMLAAAKTHRLELEVQAQRAGHIPHPDGIKIRRPAS